MADLGLKIEYQQPEGGAFCVRVYVDGTPPIRSETTARGFNPTDLQPAYRAALQKASLLTLLDGITRWVEIEKVEVSAKVSGNKQPPLNLNLATRRLMMAEIRAEEQDGPKPATLQTALDSVQGGYNPDETKFTAANMKEAEGELAGLIALYGESASLEAFLTQEDWKT